MCQPAIKVINLPCALLPLAKMLLNSLITLCSYYLALDSTLVMNYITRTKTQVGNRLKVKIAINLAKQLDRSDFLTEISLIHLAILLRCQCFQSDFLDSITGQCPLHLKRWEAQR